jgi:hypothetical protein
MKNMLINLDFSQIQMKAAQLSLKRNANCGACARLKGADVSGIVLKQDLYRLLGVIL